MFHSERENFSDWNFPSLDSFFEPLIKEQGKLIRMGVIKTSKDQALLVTDSSKAQDKGKSKKKDPKEVDSKPKHNQKNSEGTSGSKKKKFDKNICLYCVKGFHLEEHCMKNHIDQI